MEKINNLLHQVNIISNKNAEILNATGGKFNMFRICGVNHYENTHSSIIAEFLNPKGTHGLKSKLLKSFIETLAEHYIIHDFNCDTARVLTEHSTEEGRIDILIEDDQDRALIIENKIYANDQPEQLIRYDRYAKKYKNGYQIIYLTLLGDKASEQSAKDIAYLTVSYSQNIIDWLEKCVAITSRFPIVRETIIQYINHLKQLTNQDMDTKNKEEITEVLSKFDNLKAAKVIYNNYSSTFNYIIEKHFNPKMEEFAKSKGLDYHFEKSEEFYVRFHLTNPLWQGKTWIGFTFEQNRYHYGICNNPNTYKISNENRQVLHNHLNNLGIKSFKESNWWPFYAYLQNLSIDNWESDIVKSDIFFNDCKGKIEQLLIAMEKLNL